MQRNIIMASLFTPYVVCRVLQPFCMLKATSFEALWELIFLESFYLTVVVFPRYFESFIREYRIYLVLLKFLDLESGRLLYNKT